MTPGMELLIFFALAGIGIVGAIIFAVMRWMFRINEIVRLLQEIRDLLKKS